MNFTFQYPQAFWLLLLVPVFLIFFIFYQLWKKKKIRKIGEPALIYNLSASHSNKKLIIKTVILLFAFAFGCIALANPRVPDETSGEARKGIDIAIALDISNSMLAADIEPSRLERAKQMVSKLIDNLENDRVALVLFAGYGYVRFPLTFDHASAKMLVSIADPASISPTGQGTNISDALKKGALVFPDQSDRFKSIILITDGETHDEDVEETIKDISSQGIMVNTIGIGSTTGAMIEDSAGRSKKDKDGQVVISKLNEQVLKDIADKTHGVYVHLQGSDEAVQALMTQYSQIDKKALGDTSLFNYESFYYWLAIPMLLLLVAEIFIPDRKKVHV
ncbi:MAG: vWA domain-containing protein [Flavisolibacter sp.]|jgi:Ca-activated chloride channel family protein